MKLEALKPFLNFDLQKIITSATETLNLRTFHLIAFVRQVFIWRFQLFYLECLCTFYLEVHGRQRKKFFCEEAWNFIR